MEILTKILISVFVILVGAKVLHWTWTSHIDPIATIHKFLKQEPKIADVVVTRDPNKIYQGGAEVADVTGDVKTGNGEIILEQISNTSRLDRSKPIEYRRYKLKILHIGRIIGMKSVISDKGSSVLQNVMEDVRCVKVN
jgi:hypothetical protein